MSACFCRVAHGRIGSTIYGLPLLSVSSELPNRVARLAWRRIVGARNQARLWGPLTGTVVAGQAIHVAGANGCGKSTFLKALAGLHTPVAGTIERTPAELLLIGHELPLSPDLDALANLSLWLALVASTPTSREGCAAALSAAAVPIGRPVRLLSAGQRRKVALCMLPLADRLVWLLDEPLDALDAQAANWLADLCSQHLQRGGSLVYTSHQRGPDQFPRHQVLSLSASEATA
jgi:heme exporter protein A